MAGNEPIHSMDEIFSLGDAIMTDLNEKHINKAVARGLGHPISGGMIALRSTPHQPEYEIPDYCHSITAAWEVVEYLQKTNSLEIISRKDGKTMVIIQTDKYPYKEKGVGSVSDAAPMAICQAFLKLSSAKDSGGSASDMPPSAAL